VREYNNSIQVEGKDEIVFTFINKNLLEYVVIGTYTTILT